MRGKALAAKRQRFGLLQVDVAKHIPRADDPTRSITDALLSQIEHEAIRMPRGFVALYEQALADAIGIKARQKMAEWSEQRRARRGRSGIRGE